MAELHVQTKKNNSNVMWIWIVVVLAIAAAVIYFLTSYNKNDRDNAVERNTSSYIQPSLNKMIAVNTVY